ncbi:MAG: SDR family oxidoreductase [Planctomycetes bacterium]|nr:SDR family oxidoreductase [Planctomycetota bacterium]
MRCLVTGGAGFIGSHLVDRLLGGGHEVVVLDNFSTGRRQNLLQQGSRPGLTIHEGDVALLKAIQPLFEGVDWVFHLAALADIVPSIVRPLEYYRSNLDGTVVVLEASRQAGVKRFIYAASSSCYGIPDIYPTPETAPISPQYPYALTKYLGEECVLHWGKIYKLPVLSLRFFNVYGPRSRTSGTYGAVFGVFLAQKLKGKPFTVVGDGNQTRDFTFVTDVVEAVVMAAGSEHVGLVLNVGSGKAYSVNYLVELLGGNVVYIPERPGEPRCTQADITRIKSLLGWNPRVTLEKGVKILLENINYWREAPVWTPETISEATREWFEYLSK